MQYSKILAATGNKEILAVIAGLPVDQNGYFLTQEQIDGIDAALATNDTAVIDLVQAQADLGTSKAALDAANASLATAEADRDAANASLATATTEIERLQAIVPPAPKTIKAEDESEKKIDAKKYMTIYDSL